MNQLQLESTWRVRILEFEVAFATFVQVASYFEQCNHLHALVSVFDIFYIQISCYYL